MTGERKKELIRAVKFTLFSASAGLIEIVSFAFFTELLHFSDTLGYLLALVLSVLWNFTFNRRFTFQSASNVPKAMLLVALFYCVFTPVSGYLEHFYTETLGWNGYVATILNMLLNFVTEFLYDRFVVFRDSMDTNDIAQKHAMKEDAK